MKKWVLVSTIPTYLIGMSLYIIGLNFLVYAFKFKEIAVASVIFTLFNVLTLILAGKLFFDETLSPNKIIGIILALIAVIILEL